MIPAAPRPDARLDIKISAGTVKATDNRAVGGTIERGATHANVRMNPVVWLENKEGAELAFEGDCFANCRAGHELVIATRLSNGKILRVHNRATRSTIDCNDLVPLPSDLGNLVSGTVVIAIVGILPAMLAYVAVATFLRENILGRDRGSFELGEHFPYILVLLFVSCVWLMKKFIARSQAKARALSDAVDEAVRAQG